MIQYSLDPTLFHLGPLEIRYYSLVYILGFLAVLYYLNKKKDSLNLGKEDIYDLVFYLILGVIIGARLIHVLIADPSYYFNNLIKIFFVWEGGVSYHGGLLGAVIATYYFAKKKSLSFYRLADLIVIPAALFLAFGRIANFINGELIGKITSSSLCIQYPNIEGCRIPTQIYSALYRFGIFFYLLTIKNFKPGFIFWNYVLLESIGRLVIDFFREETVKLLSLTIGQWISLILIIFSIYILIKKYKN